jgi:hypothetical protein
MSSKLLNTTSTNRISFPSISLFPRSQNYIHIYFAINAISFSQKLKTTLTYSINVCLTKPNNIYLCSITTFRNPLKLKQMQLNLNLIYLAHNI